MRANPIDTSAFSLQAILDRTVRGGPNGDCMEWTGAMKPSGYGCVWHNRNRVLVHRISLALSHGLPDGMFALHRCDNRRCVNPDHLFAGTLEDNNRDMTRKGRLVVKRGSAHAMSRYSDEVIANVLSDDGKPGEVAKRHGVSYWLVKMVRRGYRLPLPSAPNQAKEAGE